MKRFIISSDHVISRQTFASRAFSLAAAAAVSGPLVYVAVTLLHPSGTANDHPAIFRQYAAAQTWLAIHLAQLAAMVTGLVGLAGVAGSMVRLQDNGRLLGLLAMGLAAASIPIAAALQSVDGIALKRAVNVWVADGATVESPTFAAARAIRWVEEGLNAVLSLALGFTIILAGGAMLRGSVYPRWMGWIGVTIGIGVLINAILVAETGFSPIAQAWVLARNPALWAWTALAGLLMWRRLRLLEATSPTSSPGDDQASKPAH